MKLMEIDSLTKQRFSSLITFQLVLFAKIVFSANTVLSVNTQIHTDDTLSNITAFHADSMGSNHVYTLSELNGKIAGNNLFYSFIHLKQCIIKFTAIHFVQWFSRIDNSLIRLNHCVSVSARAYRNPNNS